MTTKICNKCNIKQSEENFSIHSKATGKRRNYCKSCKHNYYLSIKPESKRGNYKEKQNIRTCSKCYETKDIIYFQIRNMNKNTYHSHCKDCLKEDRKNYYENNKEKYAITTKTYIKRTNNKKNLYIDNRVYSDNKKCTKCKKVLHVDNFFYDSQRQNLMSNCKTCTYTRKKLYLDNNPQIRIKKAISSRLSSCINKNYNSKTLIKYLGCSYDFFDKWLEFQLKFTKKLTLDNYGKKWHIDHVIPCSSFDFTDKKQVKKCTNWKNLRPLERIENIKKSNKILPFDIEHQKLLAKTFLCLNELEIITKKCKNIS